jgi:hypothetical protein
MSVTKTQVGKECELVHTASEELGRGRLYREVRLGVKSYRLILKAYSSTEWTKHDLKAQTDDEARLEANELIKSFGLKLVRRL